ncbi:MAG: outer membrane protein assembly factor BamD [Cyclobacteriaceae bacterium]
MRGIRVSIIFILAITLFGCSKFRKIQKSPDWKVKYEAALQYYEDEKYNKTTVLLEEILPIIRGTAEAELGNFYFAYAYYNQKQYILSAHHFEEFVTIYGRSEYVLEASYMHAYSLYLQSPEYQLDQTSTYEAIAAMQNFINKYPTTEYASDADKVIDELQVKLETKAYNTAKLYHKLRRYKSALVAFDNFKDDYPDSDFNEEISFLNIETSFDLAEASIVTRQEERYRSTVAFYEEFVDKYPTSEFLGDAEKIYAKSIEEITKFADSK